MENKNIFFIAGIFVVGLLIGGLFSGGLTGRASNINRLSTSCSSIFISPSNAYSEDVISVTIDSRECGASPILYIRDDKENRKDRILWCRSEDDFGNQVVRTGGDEDSSCFSRVTFEYKLAKYAAGVYYVEVFDDETQDYARAYFEVLGG